MSKKEEEDYTWSIQIVTSTTLPWRVITKGLIEQLQRFKKSHKFDHCSLILMAHFIQGIFLIWDFFFFFFFFFIDTSHSRSLIYWAFYMLIIQCSEFMANCIFLSISPSDFQTLASNHLIAFSKRTFIFDNHLRIQLWDPTYTRVPGVL